MIRTASLILPLGLAFLLSSPYDQRPLITAIGVSGDVDCVDWHVDVLGGVYV